MDLQQNKSMETILCFAQKRQKISLKLSYYLWLWTTHRSRWRIPNIQQNIIELTLGTRGKKKRRYSYFFLSFWQSLFSGKIKGIIINSSSAEFSQRVVMVKGKPYLCMREKCVKYRKLWKDLRHNTVSNIKIGWHFFSAFHIRKYSHFSIVLSAI